jgi:hypothetical protein
MRKHYGSGELWPAARASWHHNWGVWFVSELPYPKDVTELTELMDVVDI